MTLVLMVEEFGRDMLAWPFFREHGPDRVASVVPSFPATAATILATVCTARPADEHRVLFESDPRPDPTIPIRELTGGLDEIDPEARVLWRWRGLGADRDGFDELESWLRTTLAKLDHDLLLVGAPTSAAVRARVDLRGLDLPLRTQGSVALIESVDLEPEQRDRLLATPGVERVLDRRALELLHAPATRGTLLVAEPGWCFEDAPRTTGRRDRAEPRAEPVLVGWSSSGTGIPSWPSSVHDWRIGPTLASCFGLETIEAFDDPLPWPEATKG